MCIREHRVGDLSQRVMLSYYNPRFPVLIIDPEGLLMAFFRLIDVRFMCFDTTTLIEGFLERLSIYDT